MSVLSRFLVAPALLLASLGEAYAQEAPPAPAAGPTAPEAPQSELSTNAELEQLALEYSGADSAMESTRGVSVYGFVDFSWAKLLGKKDNLWRNIQHDKSSFAVGNLNLYLDARIADNWRSLSEIRFTYLPAGDIGLREDTQSDTLPGPLPRVDTRAADYADGGRPLRTGSIEIERVWLEHTLMPELAVRLGSWLTPYGIWNVDHGSPIIIPVLRPYPIGEQFFPERQTGIELLGSTPLGENTTIGYHGTVSNGRGPLAEFKDLDGNKALGARVFLEYGGLGRLKLGAATYYGRYTDTEEELRVRPSSDLGFAVIETVTEQYDEASFGLDAAWNWKGLHFQAEFLVNDRAYTEKGRPAFLDLDAGTILPPDTRRVGGYALTGYRFSPWALMPFVMLEMVDRNAAWRNLDKSVAYHLGVNARPIPEVALKAQYVLVTFPGAGRRSLGQDNISQVTGQVAWAF